MPTAATTQEIDVHAAVRAAVDFFKGTFGQIKLENVQLEEVDRSEDGKFWLITVGYNDPHMDRFTPLLKYSPTRVLRANHLRQYKVVRVDSRTGQALSVKIRDV